MKAAFLPDRGVVKVGGDDARNFLNGLVTTDVTLVRPGLGRFGALLTPQGKIIVDFLITEAPAGHGGGFLIDCPRALAQGLADKLGFYKLRAKVTVENLSDNLGVMAVWDGEPAMKPDLAFADPRTCRTGLAHSGAGGSRAKGRRSDRRGTGRQRRLRCPSHRARACRAAASTSAMATPFRTRPTWTGCTASISTKAAMSDRKWCRGCSIAAPRAPARCAIALDGAAPEPGTAVMAGDKPVGTMGSSAGSARSRADQDRPRRSTRSMPARR